MTEARAAAQPRASMFWRLYMLTWSALAGVAVTYLAVSGMQPGFLDAIAGKSVQTNLQTAQIERQKVSNEIETLRQTVKGLRNELQRVEARVEEKTLPPAAAVPVTAPPVPAAAPNEPAVAVVAVKQQPIAVPERAEAPEQKIAEVPKPKTELSGIKIPPLPERVPVAPQNKTVFSPKTGNAVAAVVLNGARKGRIQTGSIAKLPPPVAKPQLQKTVQAAKAAIRRPQVAPKIAFGKPVVTSTTAAVPSNASAVVVSAASSLNGLRASWQQLASQHPTLLGTLEPRYDVMGANGPYRLLAGPLSDRVEADRLCSALRVHNVTCGVGEFVGNAL